MEKRSAHSFRNNAWRDRVRRGAIVVPVEIPRGAFVSALAKRKLVPAGTPVTREQIAAHAAAVLQLWSDEQKEG